ncbi:MAG TPA: hypothetical protein ENJ00_04840, partial [Phycisphaerales bacterium]|nr:hypothetical protein [Phycisphaerales bacterium]
MDDPSRPSRPSRRSSTPASSDVDQQHEQAERLALIGSEDRPRRRRKRKIAVGVVLVGFVLLAMAPTIGGRVGKGWVERSASQALGAGVRVERLGLSWFGPQRLEGVQIVDEALRQVADVDVSMDRSLLALARNRMDLGTIRLSGELSIDQRASRTELQRDGAIESGSPTDVDRSVVFPRGLSARLELDGLDIVYRYRNQSEYSISDLTGSVSFGVGRTCEADLSAVISSDESRASATIAASVAGLTSSAGAFTPDRAMLTGSITVEGSGIPISGSLGRALRAGGDEDGAFSAALELSGTLSHGSVGLDLSAAGGRASLPMVYDRGPDAYVLSPEQDCTATLTASAVAELWPRLRRLAGASIEIGPDRLFSFDTVPACSVAIDSAHIEVPMSGGPLDLGQWILVATAELDAMSGRLDAEPWAVEPTTLTVSAFGSENAVRVQGVTTAQLGSQPAGEFVLNVSAEDLLDDRGSLRTTGEAGDWSALLGTLTGGFECNDVQSSLLDPFLRPYLDRAGVSLPDDVGERFDIELAFEDVQKRTAYLWLTSDNLSARAGVLLEDGTLRTDSAGVRVSMDSTSGILSRLLGPEGITVGSGGAVDLNIRQGSVDLDKIAAGRPGSDLTAYSGLIDLDISPMSGEVVLDGVEHTFETSPASLTLDARDLVQGAGVAASASLLVDGVDAGTLSISIDAEEIIDERGARRQGWPRIEGELSLHDAMVELAQPLADHTGLILKQDVGEHLTAIIQATADPDQHIQITGTLNSEHIDADAKLAIRDRVLYTSGSGVSVGIDRIGGWLNRVMPEGFGVEPAGKVVVSIPDAVVAIRDGRVDLSRSSLRAATEISGLELFADSDERLTIERLGADLNIPGIGEPEIGFTGTLTSKGEPVLLAGRFSADSLIRDGRLTPGSMVLDGQMDLTGWPVAGEESPVELVAEADAGDLRALAAQLFGHVLDLSIRADGDTGEIVAGVRGQRLIGSSRFRLWDGSLEHIGGKYSARIDPDVIEQIRLQRGQRAGVAGPIGPRFASPAEMEVALGACEIMQGWKPRLSGEPNVRVSLTGSVTEIALMRS